MNLTARIAERKEHEDRRHDAFSAAVAIAQMDPDTRADLITYMKAYNKAQEAGDEEEQEYLVKAIVEVFRANEKEDGGNLEAWEALVTTSPKGRQATTQLRAETDQFFKAYQQHKARCNLTTIRAVAEAAGLSPTTVQAIEKQRVKPQFKTLQSLAKAFGIKAEALLD